MNIYLYIIYIYEAILKDLHIQRNKRSCGTQKHLLGQVLFPSAQKEKFAPCCSTAFEMTFSVRYTMEFAVLSQAWLVGGDGEGWRLPQCYHTSGMRSDKDEACDNEGIWKQDIVKQMENQSTNCSKPIPKAHANPRVVKNRHKMQYLLRNSLLRV